MPKPADLAVLGLRPHDYFTGIPSLSTLNGSGETESLGRVDVDERQAELSVALPTEDDRRAYDLGLWSVL
jgi:hypothetical protein